MKLSETLSSRTLFRLMATDVRYRFSMRTFLVVVTLLCIAIGWVANIRYRAQRQSQIMDRLSKLDVGAGFAFERNPTWITNLFRSYIHKDAFQSGAHISLYKPVANVEEVTDLILQLDRPQSFASDVVKLGDRHLVRLTTIPSLKGINLFDGKYSADALRPCLRNRALQYLRAGKVDFDDQMLMQIGFMKDLRSLSFAAPNATPKGLSELSNCRSLQELIVERVTEVGSLAIAMRGLEKLHAMEINGARFSQEDAVQLGDVSQLELLTLVDCEIASGGVAELAKLSGLREIVFRRTTLAASDVVDLQRFTRIDELDVDGCINDLNVHQLLQINGGKGIQALRLSNTTLTSAGLRTLATLPSLNYLILPKNTLCTEDDICEVLSSFEHGILFGDATDGVFYHSDGRVFHYPIGQIEDHRKASTEKTAKESAK